MPAKIDLSSDTSFLEILTNSDGVTLTKISNMLGEKFAANFAVYILLFEN